jgi:hypothetical protein
MGCTTMRSRCWDDESSMLWCLVDPGSNRFVTKFRSDASSNFDSSLVVVLAMSLMQVADTLDQ